MLNRRLFIDIKRVELVHVAKSMLINYHNKVYKVVPIFLDLYLFFLCGQEILPIFPA